MMSTVRVVRTDSEEWQDFLKREKRPPDFQYVDPREHTCHRCGQWTRRIEPDIEDES